MGKQNAQELQTLETYKYMNYLSNIKFLLYCITFSKENERHEIFL